MTTTTYASITRSGETHELETDGFRTVAAAFDNARGALRVAGFHYVEDVQAGTLRVVTMRKIDELGHFDDVVLRMWRHRI